MFRACTLSLALLAGFVGASNPGLTQTRADSVPGAPARVEPPALATVWEADIGTGATTPPLATGKRLYIATARADVKALGLRRGTELWSRRLALGFQAPPVLAGSILIVAAPHPEARAFGLDVKTGATRWEQRAGDVTQAPVMDSSRVVFVSLGGAVRALAPSSGEILWESRLEGVFPGGALLDSDSVIVLAADGTLYRLDATTGKRLGSFDLEESATPGLLLLPEREGFLVVTFPGRVRGFRFDLTPLDLDFSTPAVATAAAVAGERVLLPGADRVLRAASLASGERLWEREFPVGFSAPPSVSPDGRIVAVGDLAGTVWSLDLESGEPLSRTETARTAAVPAWIGERELTVTTEGGRLFLLSHP